jgi:hypothetical protein
LQPLTSFGTGILKSAPQQRISESDFYLLSEEVKKILSKNNFAWIQKEVPQNDWKSFQMLYLVIVYLSAGNSMTYSRLTFKSDTRVNSKIENKLTFWDMNVTPQNVLRVLLRMKQTMVLIKKAPQIIFTDTNALKFCHLVGAVAKFGNLTVD